MITMITNISVACMLQSKKITMKTPPRIVAALCALGSTSNSELSSVAYLDLKGWWGLEYVNVQCIVLYSTYKKGK